MIVIIWIQIYFLHMMKVKEEVILRNYIKNVVDWIWESMHLSNRVVDHWNALSDACVTSNTINQFKNCLKQELQPETDS